MQAIQVKYLAATNFKGTRYKAWCQAKSITRSRDYALNDNEQALAVATELANELGWLDRCTMVQGSLPNGDYCHVLVRA